MLGFHFGKLAKSDDVAKERDTEFWLQQINRASILANVESGLLSTQLAKKLLIALDERREEAKQRGTKRCELYIEFEPLILKKAGMEASVFHIGRSSQDMLSTAFLKQQREGLLRLKQCTNALRVALLQCAERNREAIVPAYTNGVQAQPTLYAHYLLAQFEVFTRDIQRIDECLKRYNASPMGACVCNGTGWDLNTLKIATLLGFDGVANNAFDAGHCQTNDFPLEISQIVTSEMLHINAFLADFMRQYAQAHPWIYVTDSNGVYASSAMPQKRNPGLINDCRRDAGLVMGEAQSFLLRLQNLSLGFADQRDPLTFRELFCDAVTVVSTFTEIVSSITVDISRALAEVNNEWSCAQEIADTLVRTSKVDFRSAHRFVSDFVTWARVNKKTPVLVTENDMKTQWLAFREKHGELECLPSEFPLDAKQLASSLDPREILAHRATLGSANPAYIEEMLAKAYRQTQEDEKALESEKVKALAKEEKLNELCQQLLNMF